MFVALVLAMHAFFLWSIRERVARGDPDFTVYYTAAKMLREGRGAQLYDTQGQLKAQQEFASDWDIRRGPLPYIHPPFEALFFLPLTFLPYATAYMVWNFVNLGMLLWVWLLLRSTLVALLKIPLLDCLLASLAFFPILANFHQGQDAMLLLLVVVAGFCALDRKADFTAGCWLGLGVFKFQFVIPVVLLLIWWNFRNRGAKLAAGFAMVASAAVALSIAMVGWHAALHYPAYSWQVVSKVRLGGLPYGLMPNLVGLINGWPVLENVGWPMRTLALAACTGLFVIVAAMKNRARSQTGFKLCVACAVITSVTISYNTNTYDLSLLILPIALLLDYVLGEHSLRPHGMSMPECAPALKRLFLPALPLFISPLWFFLWLHWEKTNLMAIFLLWWICAIWGHFQHEGFPANGNGREILRSA